MRRVLIAAFLFVPSVSANAEAADLAAEDLKEMQGHWHALFMQVDGFSRPAASMNIKMHIDGDTITFGPDTKESKRGKIELDASATPKTMDLTFLNGVRKGVKTLHVYDLKNGKFYLGSFDGERAIRERPKTLETERGSQITTMVFVRGERIDPAVVKEPKGSGGGPRPAADLPDPPGTEEALVRVGKFFDALQQGKPELVLAQVELPFMGSPKPLRTREEFTAYVKTLAADLDRLGLKGELPPIKSIQPYERVQRALPEKSRTIYDRVLKKPDLFVRLHPLAHGGEAKPEYLVLVRLKGKDGQPKVVGLIPAGVPAR